MKINVTCHFIWKAAAASLALAVSAQVGVAAAEAHPDEPLATRVAEDRVLLTWSGTGPVDVYVGHKPALDAKEMQLVSDDDMDGRHEFHQSQDRRPYFLLQWERDGAIRRVAERVLALESGSNFRDVGGYETDDGRHVRWGLIYRSGAMPQLSDRDYEFLGRLGIRVLCDLRSVEERVLAPTRWEELPPARYVAVDYPASDIFRGLTTPDPKAFVNDAPPGAESPSRNLYREWPVSLAPQFQAIFAAMLAGEAPLAFNCSAGQDRTGVATALVLSALGVPRETILADYHLSTLHRRPEFERGDADLEKLADTNIVARFYVQAHKRGPDALKPRPLYDDAGRARLLATFDEIEKRWGSVERYLAEVLDVDRDDIQRLQTLYLE